MKTRDRSVITEARIQAMCEMYERDETATLASVGAAFGYSSARVQQLIKGRVTPRIGKRRKDGKPRATRGPYDAPTVVPQLFPAQHELLTRRARHIADLDRDPAVLLYRQERKAAEARRALKLQEARREFEAAHQRILNVRKGSGLTAHQPRRSA